MTPAWGPQNPPPSVSTLASTTSSSPDSSPAPDFPLFNVAQLLREGTLLLASSGKEYSEPVALGTPAEVARARKEAMNRLGLGFMDGVGDDDDDALDLGKELSQSQPLQKVDSPGPMDLDSPSHLDVKPTQPASSSRSYSPGATPGAGDLTSNASSPALSAADIKPSHINNNTANTKLPHKIKTEIPEPSELTLDSPGGDGIGLSARERNRLKRKLKTGNTAFVVTPTTSSGAAKGAASSSSAPPPNK